MNNTTFKNKKNGRQHTVFKQRYKGEIYDVRTACAILVCHDKVVMIKDSDTTGNNEKANGTEDVLEFPGGKVEQPDNSIYDTMGRELWEELFLQGKHEGEYLKNWSDVKKSIIENPDEDMNSVWISIMQKLVNSRVYIRKDGATLKTLYFIVKIPKFMSQYLVKKCNAYMIEIKALQDARSLVSQKIHLTGSPAIWRMIEVPASDGDPGKYVRIRGRELFCMPKNPK